MLRGVTLSNKGWEMGRGEGALVSCYENVCPTKQLLRVPRPDFLGHG